MGAKTNNTLSFNRVSIVNINTMLFLCLQQCVLCTVIEKDDIIMYFLNR